MAHLTPSLRSPDARDNGSAAGFEAAYEELFGRLVSMFARRIDRATAEDLAQETLVRAYRNLSRFDTSRPMWPWIKAIGRFVAADHWRRPRREIPSEIGEGPAEVTEGPDDGGILDLARARLTRRHDMAVRLRYEEDRAPHQAAAALGMSVPAFNQLLFRARRRLREEYRRLSEGLPVLTWLRWQRARVQGLGQRLHRSISSASQRLSGTLEKATAAAALTFCLVLAPIPPMGGYAPPARADVNGAPAEGVLVAPFAERPQARQRPAEARVAALEPAPASSEHGPANTDATDAVSNQKDPGAASSPRPEEPPAPSGDPAEVAVPNVPDPDPALAPQGDPGDPGFIQMESPITKKVDELERAINPPPPPADVEILDP